MDEPKDFPHRKQGCHLVLRRKKVRLKALENIFLKFYVGIKKKLTMDFVSITPLTFFLKNLCNWEYDNQSGKTHQILYSTITTSRVKANG